jgi:glycerate kinase
MTILIATDKFKGSLSAAGVCDALSMGTKEPLSAMSIIRKPMADGGDGSLAVLESYLPLETVSCEVQDPIGRSIIAQYKNCQQTAYIELAAASGLVLLTQKERNCLFTSTFGTGQLIADAIQKGAKTIYLFIGGSATNDGGIGIAQALGYQFYDQAGKALAPIGQNLVHIDQIATSQNSIDLSTIQIKVVSDVNNPFYGENGAAQVYAAQQGASPTAIATLENGLKNLAAQFVHHQYKDIAQLAGSGAAGGVGGGAVALLNAQLLSGIQFFIELTSVEEDIRTCDLVITGEGKLDRQTAQGKVVSGICQLAKKHQKPILLVCGDAEQPIPDELGIHQLYTIREQVDSLEIAIATAATQLQQIGQQIALQLNENKLL